MAGLGEQGYSRTPARVPSRASSPARCWLGTRSWGEPELGKLRDARLVPVAAGGFGPGGKKLERSTGESKEGLSHPGSKFGKQASAHPLPLLGMNLSTSPDPLQVLAAKTLPEVRQNQTQPLTHRWPPPRNPHEHTAREVPAAPLHEKSQPTATRDGLTSAVLGLPSPKLFVQTQNELEATGAELPVPSSGFVTSFPHWPSHGCLHQQQHHPGTHDLVSAEPALMILA